MERKRYRDVQKKSSRSEAAIQKDILTYLALNGKCWVVKVMAANIAGVPDILCCYQGRLLGIEVKRPGGRTSARQRYNLMSIQSNGGFSAVVHNLDETRAFLDQVDKEIEK